MKEARVLPSSWNHNLYQTSWFYGLMFITIVGVGFDIARIRIWQLLKREKELTIRIEEATAKIKTLDGLVSICANCKKIRDDKGYWDQLEGYIQSHAEAKFSHGVCPACAEKLINQQNVTSAISPPSDSPKE